MQEKYRRDRIKRFTEKDLWRTIHHANYPLNLSEHKSFASSLPSDETFTTDPDSRFFNPYKIRILADLVRQNPGPLIISFEDKLSSEMSGKDRRMREALDELHQRGWIYQTGVKDIEDRKGRRREEGYVAPSALHLAYIERRLVDFEKEWNWAMADVL